MLVHEGFELLGERECYRLMGERPVGRVGISIGALPAIFPVNHLMDGESIVFCTAEGTKLAAAVRNAVIAFEVDDYDEATRSGWSVLAVGAASETFDPELLRRIRLHGGGPWAQGDRSHLVRITPSFVSGRRIVPTG